MGTSTSRIASVPPVDDPMQMIFSVDMRGSGARGGSALPLALWLAWVFAALDGGAWTSSHALGVDKKYFRRYSVAATEAGNTNQGGTHGADAAKSSGLVIN